MGQKINVSLSFWRNNSSHDASIRTSRPASLLSQCYLLFPSLLVFVFVSSLALSPTVTTEEVRWGSAWWHVCLRALLRMA